MSNLVKCMLLVMMIFNPLTWAQASVPDQKLQKTFIIRYSSKEPGLAIPFNSETMVITNKGTEVASIKQVTPFATTVTASFVGVMLHIQEGGPEVKLEIAEKTDQGENLLLSGSGHALFAHDDANGMGFVMAR